MDDFILINEIEKRGQLYDHSDPKYKDKRQRDAGWRAVSEAVGITGEYTLVAFNGLELYCVHTASARQNFRAWCSHGVGELEMICIYL